MSKEPVRSLLDESRQFMERSSSILSGTDIMRLLGKYGKPTIIGSCAADLMMTGDIDIQVVGGSYDRDTFLKILGDIVRLEYFESFLLVDENFFDQYREGNFPRGWYIGPRITIDRVPWSVDIWFLTESEAKKHGGSKHISISEERTTKAQKLVILETKKWARDHGRSASQEIYQAVLREGILTSDEVIRRLKLMARYGVL